MKRQTSVKPILLSIITTFTFSTASGADIYDFYRNHKNDPEMESRIIPPKAASLLVDKEYKDAIDILKSLRSLRYLNFYGDKKKISEYAKSAIKFRGEYEKIFEDSDHHKTISVFGIRKNNKVKKVMAVYQGYNQFILLIGKGSLTQEQIEKFPELSKEIQ